MLKEEYKDCNIHDFDSKKIEDVDRYKISEELIEKAARIYPIEPSYDFFLGFYNGMFQIEAKTTQDLTYDYLKGFYEGVRVRRPKN